ASRATSAPFSTSSSPPKRARPSPASAGESTVLTADLVRTRTKGSELFVTELGPKQRPRALELARDYLGLAEGHVGATRAELEEAFQGVRVSSAERKLALGLCKLVEDRLSFDVQSDLDPRLLRREIFTKVAQARAALEEHVDFDRD